MHKTWIMDDGAGGYFLQTSLGYKPKNAVALSPLDNGVQVTDIDWLDIIDILDVGGEVIGKEGVVNFTKKSAKELTKQAEKDAKKAEEDARQARRDALKALKKADLATDNDIKQAIIDIIKEM